MNKDLFKKTGFAVLLIGLGFSLEYLFYSRKPDPPRSGTTRILIVGGSIADSVTKGLKSTARNQKLDKFEFFTLAYPLMSSEVALTMIRDTLPILKPEALFLLLGMHEKNSGANEDLLDPKWRKGILDLAFSKDRMRLNNYIVQVLEEILRLPDVPKDLNRLINFVSMETITEHLSRDILEPQLLRILKHEMTRHPVNLKRISRIFVLSETLLLNRSEFKGPNVVNVLQYFNNFLKDSSISHPALFNQVDFLWRDFVSREAGHEELKDYLVSHPDIVLAFSRRFYFLTRNQNLGRENLDPRVLLMLEKVKETHANFGVDGHNMDGKEDSFIENLVLIKKMLSEKGILLVLLQYPNTDWAQINNAGRILELKVVENKSAFGKVLKKDNYYIYFAAGPARRDT